ncbi:MAG: hypothetical protein ACYCS8_04800 [Acidithiobacillus sp.]
MKIIKQIVIPDINIKVLFIETARHHFHIVAMDIGQRFYRVSGKNVRWLIGSFSDTSRAYEWRCYAAERLYWSTVREYREDARARRTKKFRKLLSMAA